MMHCRFKGGRGRIRYIHFSILVGFVKYYSVVFIFGIFLRKLLLYFFNNKTMSSVHSSIFAKNIYSKLVCVGLDMLKY